ncbi:hypothetical protein J437_LFUL017130 [Ladona fulva]|uniref:Reverse transcriptase domain-containing protein n=1 Tax=Ladona fulva TaxID=123851 RepID=A0A8K0KSP3_LADFU|nr:hypothetical protein J437_LFUL017130 [Ladona fulva]
MKFSADIDDVPKFKIQLSFDLIKDPLLYLINTSFLVGTFPSALKISQVLPLFKRKNSTNDFNSYRPIALQMQFSKIFDKAFHKRLVSYLQGFRQTNSTVSAIHEIISHLHSTLDNRLISCALMLDF